VPLAEYNRKRDFEETPEPRGRAAKSHRRPIFVIQEHHASRLHYDFRLEADGVLKSWAVPKKPTLSTSVRRLAVRVEDHPLEYASFSGQIPEGKYGAGSVEIWDKGTYENLQEKKPGRLSLTKSIKQGHVEVKLQGRKLKGKFALIRMHREGKKENWLLIKMKDDDSHRDVKRTRGAKTRTTRPTSSARAKKREAGKSKSA
jgi:bifunctional non-homologous end joining protein LigD